MERLIITAALTGNNPSWENALSLVFQTRNTAKE
jgi:hypothetical protein